MNKKEFITERTNIISRMLDNPDEYGIYPTTKCFNELDALYDRIVSEAIAEHDKAIIDDIDFGYSADMIKGKLINKSYEP